MGETPLCVLSNNRFALTSSSIVFVLLEIVLKRSIERNGASLGETPLCVLSNNRFVLTSSSLVFVLLEIALKRIGLCP